MVRFHSILAFPNSLYTKYVNCVHFDSTCSAVYVLEFGKWNYRKFSQMSAEKVEEFWMYYEQCARRAERDSALHNGEGTCFIVDWDGFSLKHYAAGRGE